MCRELLKLAPVIAESQLFRQHQNHVFVGSLGFNNASGYRLKFLLESLFCGSWVSRIMVLPSMMREIFV